MIDSIVSHDQASMLSKTLSSTTSHDYLGEERRGLMRQQINAVDPFSKKREKIVFFDKSMGSPFCGMTMEKISMFVNRNKKNIKRKFS